MTVALYFRVSTADQDWRSQREECERWSARLHPKASIVEYSDVASATSRGMDDRPGWRELMHKAFAGELVRIIVAEVSRLSRDVAEGATVIKQLRRLGCPLYVVRGAYDTGTKHGTMGALFELVTAETEATWISERTKAGLARSKAKGGRPTAIATIDAELVVQMRDAGSSWSVIADTLGKKRSTVRRAYTKAKEAA